MNSYFASVLNLSCFSLTDHLFLFNIGLFLIKAAIKVKIFIGHNWPASSGHDHVRVWRSIKGIDWLMPVCVQRMGVLNVGQRIEEQVDFEKIYKNGTTLCVCACVRACVCVSLTASHWFLCVWFISGAAWADNANACAVQYAGTGALKTDFTRYSNTALTRLARCVSLRLLFPKVSHCSCSSRCCCGQDGEEDQGGTADGRVELHDSLLQEQLLRWLQTGTVSERNVAT